MVCLSGAISAGLLAALAAAYFAPLLNQKGLSWLPKAPVLAPSVGKNQTKISRPQLLLAASLLLCLLIMAFVDFGIGLLLLFLVIGAWYAVERGPRWRKASEGKKKQAQLGEVFPQALGMAVQALKTGQTVPQVLEYLSKESPRPLREELSQVCAEMNLGSSAEQALGKMAERFQDFSEFHQFLESYKISRQTGANLTHLLEVLLEGMEEKNRLLRKMQAMTAQARLSGLMMGLLPFLLALVFFCMDPELMTPLFTTPTGWAIVFLAMVLEAIGFFWIRQLLQLEV